MKSLDYPSIAARARSRLRPDRHRQIADIQLLAGDLRRLAEKECVGRFPFQARDRRPHVDLSGATRSLSAPSMGDARGPQRRRRARVRPHGRPGSGWAAGNPPLSPDGARISLSTALPGSLAPCDAEEGGGNHRDCTEHDQMDRGILIDEGRRARQRLHKGRAHQDG